MKFINKSAFKAYQSGNKVSLVKSGEGYFSLLAKIIAEAQNEIHLHTYILKDDSTGKFILEELKKARNKGVKVYLLIDRYGSRDLSDYFIKEIIDSGIYFRYFSPFINSKGFHFGRRLHQKVVAIDSKIALISGINIADRYRGINGEKPWLDFGLFLEGSICLDIEKICASFWNKKFINKKFFKNINIFLKESRPLVRIRQNDWLRNKSQISKSYKYAFKNAEKYITIVGAYFLPGRKLRHLIKKAVKRGVKVKVVLSQKSDEKIFSSAMNYLYPYLHKNGIEIYEYYGAVVHGKALVVDDEWLTIGSHDMNFLSTYGMIEMNVDVIDVSLAKNFNLYLEDIIKNDCKKVSSEYFLRNSFLKKSFDAFIYFIMKISLFLLIFITNKSKSNE